MSHPNQSHYQEATAPPIESEDPPVTYYPSASQFQPVSQPPVTQFQPVPQHYNPYLQEAVLIDLSDEGNQPIGVPPPPISSSIPTSVPTSVPSSVPSSVPTNMMASRTMMDFQLEQQMGQMSIVSPPDVQPSFDHYQPDTPSVTFKPPQVHSYQEDFSPPALDVPEINPHHPMAVVNRNQKRSDSIEDVTYPDYSHVDYSPTKSGYAPTTDAPLNDYNFPPNDIPPDYSNSYDNVACASYYPKVSEPIHPICQAYGIQPDDLLHLKGKRIMIIVNDSKELQAYSTYHFFLREACRVIIDFNNVHNKMPVDLKYVNSSFLDTKVMTKDELEKNMEMMTLGDNTNIAGRFNDILSDYYLEWAKNDQLEPLKIVFLTYGPPRTLDDQINLHLVISNMISVNKDEKLKKNQIAIHIYQLGNQPQTVDYYCKMISQLYLPNICYFRADQTTTIDNLIRSDMMKG